MTSQALQMTYLDLPDTQTAPMYKPKEPCLHSPDRLNSKSFFLNFILQSKKCSYLCE